MAATQKSKCPINLSLEIFGDKWTLLILRDLVFAGKCHFREFLQSEEGIASNVLAERLANLVACGILTKSGDPTHQQKAIYGLTPMGIDLVPVLAQIGIWGKKHLAVTRQSAAFAAELEKGGPKLVEKLQADLRKKATA
jgi:DNA-binding HxlR family transcriptional regulator